MNDIETLRKLVKLQMDCMDVANFKFPVSQDHNSTTLLLKYTNVHIAYIGGMISKYPAAMIEQVAREFDLVLLRVDAKDIKL